jgi:glucosamine--fructose-6-phosphate aminotransferase (isomerizing)
MCGIIGVTGSANPAEVLLEGLRTLEYRGYDSAGVALNDLDGHSIWRAREAERARSIENLDKTIESAPAHIGASIGHTRWATHGAPNEVNAHPHVDCSGHIALVHNGIIENHRELQTDLEARGHVMSSATDTEVVAHLIEDEVRAGADLTHAVRASLARLRGDFAIAVVSSDEPDLIVGARRTSPLILGRKDGTGYLASDIAALLAETRELYQLEDGQVAAIRPGSIEVFDSSGELTEARALEINWDVSAAQKGGYADFMSKEMREQPAAIAETLLGRVRPDGQTDFEELAISDEELARITRVVYVACGSSYHASSVARIATERLARMPAEADIASEFRYRDVVIGPETLVVAVSQSGETVDTLHALREAKRLGARTIALTNVVDSVMTREADGILYTRAGPEIGVASTKCHVAQLALLEAFSLHLARVRGNCSDAVLAENAQAILALPEKVATTLERAADYEAIAASFADTENFYFLGRRTGYPIAQEGALKLKELAYVRAEAYPAGELKHGPISLIEPGSVVVVIANRSELWEKVMLNVAECRARGATVIGVADDGDSETASLLDATFFVPATSEICSPLVDVVPLQFFAYGIARARGNDVDRPRNLAKVVTVE